MEKALGIIVTGVALACIRQFAGRVESPKVATFIHDILFGSSAGAFVFSGANMLLASQTHDQFLQGVYPMWAMAGAVLGTALFIASTILAFSAKKIPWGAFLWLWAAGLAVGAGVLMWFRGEDWI